MVLQFSPIKTLKIDEQFKEEDRNKNFKIVEHLVWGLLRLARTYEVSPFGESRASLNEAFELIVGNTPLKSKSNIAANEPPLCGEKAYGVQFNAYKSDCHFVAAYKHLEGNDPSFSLTQPEHIGKFLSLSHWFRAKLLTLKTPNVKEKFMFSEESLLSLPEWISSNDIHISIDLYEDKLQKLIATLQKVA
ncbi:MAG: hypothetical protein K2Y18_01030 [Alphaproteobacteria bacterium]|jgi:hypothetical protein|nr:hypothetical protein [Alphaproteobacteria bacterium]